MTPYEELTDYRRRVSEMYGRVRQPGLSVEERWVQFRRERDALFICHPQSALSDSQKAEFNGLDYFPYNPDLRFVLDVDRNVSPDVFDVELSDDGLFRIKRFGQVCFEVMGQPFFLSVFWILGYGGGVFLPFRDSTNRTETYGGGRYLLDSIKGVDLGQENSKLVLDFNFAYNPSCAYNFRWHCPLPLPENWLPVPILAGEKKFDAYESSIMSS